MHSWIQRGLRTALLTGGFLAVGAGVAAADENDLTADLLGVTATVPVVDDAVVQTPVLTGHGGNTTIGSGTGGGIELPVDTNTVPGTTVLGSDGTGGVSVPVRVVEPPTARPTRGTASPSQCRSTPPAAGRLGRRSPCRS
jgi:hypothetical protein